MLKIDGVSLISGKDERLIEACLKVMNARGLQVPFTANSGEEGAKQINQAIASQDWSNEEKDHAIKMFLNEAKQNLLPLSELDWIKKSERACYWCWAAISRNQFFATPNHPVIQPAQDQQWQYVSSYTQLGLKNIPSTSKERFDEVVKFFDRVGQPLQWQQLLVERLKSDWSFIYNSRKPFSWLKKDNEDQCRWAWEYMQSYGTKQGLMDRPTTGFIQPVGLDELYLSIYGAFDTWNTSKESKTLFLQNFNKAWHQKKHRDGRQGKKACNLVLREDVKDKLDEMANIRGLKLNQLVEILIENEYSNLAMSN